MNEVAGSYGTVVLLQPLAQSMSGDADNGIDLGIKAIRTPQRLHGNAVLLDCVDGPVKVLVADISQEANKIVAPAEHL
jgi:hypothetical protein